MANITMFSVYSCEFPFDRYYLVYVLHCRIHKCRFLCLLRAMQKISSSLIFIATFFLRCSFKFDEHTSHVVQLGAAKFRFYHMILTVWPTSVSYDCIQCCHNVNLFCYVHGTFFSPVSNSKRKVNTRTHTHNVYNMVRKLSFIWSDV